MENQIRYYKYFGIHLLRTCFLITIHNTVRVPQKTHLFLLPQPGQLPAAVQAGRVSEQEHSSASKMQKEWGLRGKKSLFFSCAGLSPRHSSIQCSIHSLFTDSQNCFCPFLIPNPPSRFFKWRSPPPLTPAPPGLGRGLIATSSALSSLEGWGEKMGVNTYIKCLKAKTDIVELSATKG